MNKIQIDLVNACSDMKGRSHFFGAPTFSKKMAKCKLDEQVLFVGQLSAKELRAASGGELFKKDGWLYVFYDVYTREFSVCFDGGEQISFADGINKKVLFGNYQTPTETEIAEYENEAGAKAAVCMLLDVPEEAVLKNAKYANYTVLFRFDADVFEKLSKPFLVKNKKYAYVLIATKDLIKGKFSKIITFHD